MRKILVEKSPDSDETDKRFEHDVLDIARSLEDICACEVFVEESYKEITIRSDISESDLKKMAKPLFSYHFDTVRFVSIS